MQARPGGIRRGDGLKPLEIYVHVPFCVSKCRYCDFLSFSDPSGIDDYFNALLKEISCFANQMSGRYEVTSVFFGGGTPSFVSEKWIARVMETIFALFTVAKEAEHTIELNPGTVSRQKLRAYLDSGINRMSFGLQSIHGRELKALGRIHRFSEFVENYREARELGASNVSVDLMCGLPGQSLASWQQTLGTVADLAPEHLSVYSLIIEEGTPFYEQYAPDEQRRARGEMPRWLPTEETEREMIDWTGRFLRERGYAQYEISNYSRPGYVCRHNEGYWLRKDYIGFGLGASSLLSDVRTRNTASLSQYCSRIECGESACEQQQRLTEKEVIEEVMFLGLRRCAGVSFRQFRAQTGREMRQVYEPVLSKLSGQGLLNVTDEGVSLTARGFDLANFCMAQFLLE